jgi:hypothetical protein
MSGTNSEYMIAEGEFVTLTADIELEREQMECDLYRNADWRRVPSRELKTTSKFSVVLFLPSGIGNSTKNRYWLLRIK